MEHKSHTNLPRIGITMGDFNGVGIEVIMKALQDPRILRVCVPVLYGSGKALAKYKKILGIENFTYHQINDGAIHDRKINVVNCWDAIYWDINPGETSDEAGKCAYFSLAKSSEDLRNGVIDGVVTAPINKSNIQSADFQFAGHTEYYANLFAQDDFLMCMISEHLRIATLTGHIPLAEVPSKLNRELIIKKISTLIHALKYDFGINKPNIAILGLNPHAGERGLLGAEESSVIEPAIKYLQDLGHLVFGTFPADGFFGMMQHRQFDAVVSMYHDQGLIPFKMLAFEDGVNYTAGLSIVRTSPDHGTAYDIAGKGLANESSMRTAILLACDIIKQRKENRKPKEEKPHPNREKYVFEIEK
ncbi:MAG: 4-hydroxythreonine-4-phosphate dehydrogenase PdxA [Thermoflexibacter sp.]|jgi:4-hydroxythreonine-4-phosphate dehydrogenase|nr:4-hydroxythreonine-4-phosphate dehydrogenase PdxA [Thermoflexibacter sp.]